MRHLLGYTRWESIAPADLLFRNGISLVCFFFAIAFILSYIALGSSTLFDINTLLIVLLQLALIIAGVQFIRPDPVRIILMCSSLILAVYAYPRLLQYLISVGTIWMGYGAGTSVGGIPITSQMVNHALIYQTGCFILILFGAFLAAKMVRSSGYKEDVLLSKIKWLPLLILIFFYVCIRDNAIQEKIWQMLGGWLPLNHFHGLLEILFNLEMLFFMVLAQLYRQTNGFSKQYGLLLALTVPFLIFKIYAGSRGGGNLVIFYFAFILLTSGKQLVPVAKIITYIMFVIVISIASFSWATKIRQSDIIVKQIETTQKKPAQEAIVDSYITYAQTGNGGLYSLLNRMGAYIDALVVTTNLTPVEHLKTQYMTVEYALKSAINIALPGVYYECCVINTSFLPPFMFGKRSEPLLYTPGYYESTLWTPQGFGRMAFNAPYDIIFMLLSGWLLGAAYLVCMRTSYRMFVLPFFAMQGIYMFFLFQGLDAYLVDIQKFGLSAFVAVLMLQFVNKAEDVSRFYRAAINSKLKRQSLKL